jgi:hypothetical protein
MVGLFTTNKRKCYSVLEEFKTLKREIFPRTKQNPAASWKRREKRGRGEKREGERHQTLMRF